MGPVQLLHQRYTRTSDEAPMLPAASYAYACSWCSPGDACREFQLNVAEEDVLVPANFPSM
jgi:hypothetical protein